MRRHPEPRAEAQQHERASPRGPLQIPEQGEEREHAEEREKNVLLEVMRVHDENRRDGGGQSGPERIGGRQSPAGEQEENEHGQRRVEGAQGPAQDDDRLLALQAQHPVRDTCLLQHQEGVVEVLLSLQNEPHLLGLIAVIAEREPVVPEVQSERQDEDAAERQRSAGRENARAWDRTRCLHARGRIREGELRPRLLGPVGWALAGLAFALAYTQAPLFTGNQNSKFLIGLARAGYGSLSRDWLANTTDPFPLFTALVRWTAAAFPPEAFYVYSVIFIGVYAYALVGIGAALSRIGRSRAALFVYFVLLAFLHSRLLGRLSLEAVGWNAPRLLHYGVADQYILGRVFQPCVFGVLLPLSVLLFLRGRHRVAALLLGAAAAMHPAYAFGVVCLTLAYAVVLRREGRGVGSIVAMALLALLPVAPVLLRDYVVLRPASPELWKAGMEILLRERIPHHASPGGWFGVGAAIQIVLMLGAIVAVRRTRLFLVLLVPFAAGVLLTVCASAS